MDIAKIRKKSREQGQEKQPEQKNEIPRPGPEAVEEKTVMPAPDALPGIVSQELPEQAPAVEAPQPLPAETGIPSKAEEEELQITELLTFSLDKEEFAFRVSEVEEIIRFQRITILPTVPDYVAGISSLRGKIIPVIDLKTRLALHKRTARESAHRTEQDSEEADIREKIVILSGPKGLIGAIIDRVNGVVRLPADIIMEPPGHLTAEETRFIEGVVIVDKRFISIIRSEDALNIEIG